MNLPVDIFANHSSARSSPGGDSGATLSTGSHWACACLTSARLWKVREGDARRNSRPEGRLRPASKVQRHLGPEGAVHLVVQTEWLRLVVQKERPASFRTSREDSPAPQAPGLPPARSDRRARLDRPLRRSNSMLFALGIPALVSHCLETRAGQVRTPGFVRVVVLAAPRAFCRDRRRRQLLARQPL